MSNTRLLPTRDVARRLGVHARTVHRMVKDGRLTPAFTAPGYRGDHLFDPADIEALLDGPTHDTADHSPILRRGA